MAAHVPLDAEGWPSGHDWWAYEATVNKVVDEALQLDRCNGKDGLKSRPDDLRAWRLSLLRLALRPDFDNLADGVHEAVIATVRRQLSILAALPRRGKLPLPSVPTLFALPPLASHAGRHASSRSRSRSRSQQRLPSVEPIVLRGNDAVGARRRDRIRKGSYKGRALDHEGWPTGTTWPDFLCTVEIVRDDAEDNEHIMENPLNLSRLRGWVVDLVRDSTRSRFYQLPHSRRGDAIDSIKDFDEFLIFWPASTRLDLPTARALFMSHLHAVAHDRAAGHPPPAGPSRPQDRGDARTSDNPYQPAARASRSPSEEHEEPSRLNQFEDHDGDINFDSLMLDFLREHNPDLGADGRTRAPSPGAGGFGEEGW